jgi:hypothetical protein
MFDMLAIMGIDDAVLGLILGAIMTGIMGYGTVKGAKDTNRQLRMGEKSLEMEDIARQTQLDSDKMMNKQKKSMTEKYLAEASKEKSKERRMQMLQMAMSEKQGMMNAGMSMMGGITNDLATASRPDPRYITSLLQ